MSLKELTSEKHRAAEQTAFMQALVKKQLPNQVWKNFIYQKWLIYKLIEGSGGAYCGLNNCPDLYRTFLLFKDMQELSGDSSNICPSTREYYNYLLQLKQPEKIWAHIYVWHMGDLYGGQMIKTLTPGSNFSLDFDNKQEDIAFIRKHLSDDMAHEANLAFDFAIKIMNDLF